LTGVSRVRASMLVAAMMRLTIACSDGSLSDAALVDAAWDAQTLALDAAATDAGAVSGNDAGERCGPVAVDVAELIAKLPAFDVWIAGCCTADELAKMRDQAASTTSGSEFFAFFTGSCRECAIRCWGGARCKSVALVCCFGRRAGRTEDVRGCNRSRVRHGGDRQPCVRKDDRGFECVLQHFTCKVH
jgi:hypothetical protein